MNASTHRERLDRCETVAAFIPALAAEFGCRPAVVSADETLTYAGLEEQSRRLALGLLVRGVGKGSRVGVRFGNTPDWVVWWAAVSRIGAMCVPISTFLRPPELVRVVRHADLHGLVTADGFLGQDYVAQLETAFDELGKSADPDVVIAEAPFLRWVIVAGRSDIEWARPVEWLGRSVIAGDELLARAEWEVHPDDEAIMIYTSGQSAAPKGVVHTHRSVMTKVHYLRDMLGFDESSEVDANLPFFWVGGLVMALFTCMGAGGVVVCERDRTTYGSEQVIGAQGSQPDPYPGLKLAPALGMTETFGMYSWGSEWRVAGSEISAPLDVFQPGFDVELVDADGVAVADGERGQIVVRGPSVASRLHKVDRTTCFDRNGFYQTGDEGQRDGDRIHFTGRSGDMIKTSGANVAPAEVEAEILALEGVARAHVVAVNDAARDQLVAAAVIVEPSSSWTPEAIRAALRERLSPYKVPRKVAIYQSADAVPMTLTLKVNKPALAAQLASCEDLAG